MTKIFEACATDLHRLTALAREFAACEMADPDGAATNWHAGTCELLRNGMARVFFCTDNDDLMGRPVGLLAVLVVPHPWTLSVQVHEQLWFVTQEYRDTPIGFALVRHLDGVASDLGASQILITHLYNEVGERLRRILPRYGYRPLEINYTKEVN